MPARLLAVLTDLVLSRCCAGCAAPDVSLCRRCAVALARPRPQLPRPCPPGLPETWVAGSYAGPVRAAVLAFKERGRADLTPVLAAALARTVAAAVPGSESILLVPIPSRPAALRQRGTDHMRVLARGAAAHLGAAGRSAAVLPALRLVRSPRDSAGLAADERTRNLRGVFAAAPRTAVIAGGARLVLVDDIVTTGTTLAEAARALRARGVEPTAAALAGTLRRHDPWVSEM